MNGEVSISDENVTTGQIFILDPKLHRGLADIKACYYDGTEITLKENACKKRKSQLGH